MIPVAPHPVLGILFHGIGAFFSANCYAPQNFIRRWSWQTFWMVQAAWCWFLWPIIVAFLTIPQLLQVLSEAPKAPMLISFLMGLAYGVGGTAFNLSIRYIGFALTYSIAVGLSSILGTIVPPLVRGEAAQILDKPGAGYALLGIISGTLGIAVCGIAGRLKELDLQEQHESPGSFCLWKGLTLSILAGVLSAVYGFALEAAKPVVEVAAQHGAGYWKGNIAYLFANTGAFITAASYAGFLAFRQSTWNELIPAKSRERGDSPLSFNYFLAFLTGTLWFGQFFFYNLGHVRMGKFEFVSWAIHMIMLVLFSNLVALFFREWRGCKPRTHAAIQLGLLLLLGAIVLISYGNYISEPITG